MHIGLDRDATALGLDGAMVERRAFKTLLRM